MTKVCYSIALIFLGLSLTTQAQYTWNLPSYPGWNIIEEGDTISLNIKVIHPDTLSLYYAIDYEEELNISFDSLGQFQWSPSYELVSRVEEF